MSDIHIIPKAEKDQHYEDINCPCGPSPRVDAEEGIMYWTHHLMNPEQLFSGIFKF